VYKFQQSDARHWLGEETCQRLVKPSVVDETAATFWGSRRLFRPEKLATGESHRLVTGEMPTIGDALDCSEQKYL
jgi:hypothetical protein